MNKVYIQNLGMIVTNDCNLNCEHCLRGCKSNKKMSKEVIESTLNQLRAIGNLILCGGEPTLALDVIKKIFSYISDNKILVHQISTTINGTNYSLEFLRLLESISNYLPVNKVIFTISYDTYHLRELKRLNIMKNYLENMKRYSESKYFYGLRTLEDDLKLFREGNAENLNKDQTINLKPIDLVITYADKFLNFDRKGLCNIGPMMAVNTNGIITEENSSTVHQEILYNYGNVFDDSFEEVALKRGRIIKPRQWNRKTNKIIQKYVTYNK